MDEWQWADGRLGGSIAEVYWADGWTSA